MLSARQNATIETYANIMQEVKTRIAAIDPVILGNTKLPDLLATEFAYLQIRFICELVALGCLVAHGDIEEAQGPKLQKAYNADMILKMLGDLHADFYPIPITLKPGTTIEQQDYTDVKDGYLTKAELQVLYGECGNKLHRGSLKNLLSAKPPSLQRDLQGLTAIQVWRRKIIALLNVHHIRLHDSTKSLNCWMKTPVNNRVRVVLATFRSPAASDVKSH